MDLVPHSGQKAGMPPAPAVVEAGAEGAAEMAEAPTVADEGLELEYPPPPELGPLAEPWPLEGTTLVAGALEGRGWFLAWAGM
jgi:hypothetical protein